MTVATGLACSTLGAMSRCSALHVSSPIVAFQRVRAHADSENLLSEVAQRLSATATGLHGQIWRERTYFGMPTWRLA